MLRSLSVQVLIALALGLAIGAAVAAYGASGLKAGVEGVEAVGGLWLNSLRMTIIPLVFSLLVVGIASVTDAAATGRLAARALGWFAVLIVFASLYAMAAANGILALWPVSAEASAALLRGVGAAREAIPAQPPLGDWIKSLAPANPVKAAAEDAILPLVVFSVFFGFAATRLSEDLRRPLLGFFQAISDVMITIVRWVLVVAPFGVFALALGVGLRAGVGAAGVIAHYVGVVVLAQVGLILLTYLLPVVWGRMPLITFARGAAPAQAVAFSTQSSLASLPAMVERAQDSLGIPQRVTGLVLPLAVALFRITSPVANLAVAFFMAAVYGLHPSVAQIAGAVAVSWAISVSSVGLPGQVSFFASLLPICLALGVPVELLPILLAVEVAPDIFRTVGNVTGDLAVTTVLARGEPRPSEMAEA
ncbi:MAG TPA: dicarboxylate/amino acid:cation symporter [Caulobacteraceae bacterium]|jgi:Na+/H+-dicarboxylate symporter